MQKLFSQCIWLFPHYVGPYAFLHVACLLQCCCCSIVVAVSCCSVITAVSLLQYRCCSVVVAVSVLQCRCCSAVLQLLLVVFDVVLVLQWDVGGRGRDPRKQKGFCTTVKKRPKKNLMSVGRRRLLQHYWYKVPALLIIKYQLMSAW